VQIGVVIEELIHRRWMQWLGEGFLFLFSDILLIHRFFFSQSKCSRLGNAWSSPMNRTILVQKNVEPQSREGDGECQTKVRTIDKRKGDLESHGNNSGKNSLKDVA